MNDDTLYVGTIALKVANGLKMKERAKNDRYATDPRAIKQWIAHADLDAQFTTPHFICPIRAMDTGCGKDARWGVHLHNAIRAKHLPHHSIVVGLDINADGGSDQDIIKCFSGVDYLDAPIASDVYNLLFGNPPFNIANAWLEKSFDIVCKNLGRVSYLFPITLAATKARRELYRTYPISRMLIYSQRVSFDGYDGGTYPAREYAQFEWWFKDGQCLTPRELVKAYDIEPIDYLG